LDKDSDRVWQASEVAGYESWEDSLGHFKDTEGNPVDISDRFDENGNWIPGADSIQNFTLEYNPDELVEWTAEEHLDLIGGDFRLGDSGVTAKSGTADVLFSNGEKSFGAQFSVTSQESLGYFASVFGKSISKTKYTRMMPRNYTNQKVANSFTGLFVEAAASISAGFFSFDPGYTFGVNSDGSVPDNPWKGWTFGGSVGFGFGSGAGLIETDYTLIPESVSE